jgi:hypothetical protein
MSLSLHCDNRFYVVSIAPSSCRCQTNTSKRPSPYTTTLIPHTTSQASARHQTNALEHFSHRTGDAPLPFIIATASRHAGIATYRPPAIEVCLPTSDLPARVNVQYCIGHLPKLLVRRQDRRPHKDSHHPAFNLVASPAYLTA